MQFSELICISDIHMYHLVIKETDLDWFPINMDHLGINVDQFLWVPSIAEISPRFFDDN